MKEHPRRLLGVTQVAALLGVSRKTVYRLVDDEALPYLRVRTVLRFDAADVDRFIEEGKTKP